MKDTPIQMKVDPVTFQVVGYGLASTAREMADIMTKTAYSPIFVEGQDFSCAILDRSGELVAMSNNCPAHLAAMELVVTWATLEAGIETLKPGDVMMHNDPFRGGTHISDFTVLKPVFFEGQLVAVTANRAHQLDMGGKAPGSFAGDATTSYEEGLRIPPVRWYKGGTEDTDIFDIILSNVRYPHVQIGDFRAQLYSNLAGERRVLAFCEKYGVETFLATLEELKDYTERWMRNEIKAMPDGVYNFEDFLDDDGITSDPLKIKASVTIDDEEITVDFTGSSPQARGAINSSYGVTATATYNALLCATAPDIPVTHGCFRPVKIIAPRGSLLNPAFPAATMGDNLVTNHRIFDVVYGALAQAVPERAIAATGSIGNNFSGGGWDPERSQPFGWYFWSAVGWGAGRNKDGLTSIIDPIANCRDQPAEVIEQTLPLRVESVELVPDSAGAGKFRGGFGNVRTVTVLGDECTVSAMSDRAKFAPWGLCGGQPGSAANFLYRSKGTEEFKSFVDVFGVASPTKFANVPLHRGDSVRLLAPGGGGYGDPLERSPDMVLEDAREELVSVDSARDTYGVVLHGMGPSMAVDTAETEKLRAEMQTRPREQVDGIFSFGKASDQCRQDFAHQVLLPDPTDSRILEGALSRLNRGYCREDCPKKADPQICPFYNQEALDFWSTDALAMWSRKNCPQRPM